MVKEKMVSHKSQLKHITKSNSVKDYRFVEFFAGTANASWCLKEWGLHGLSFDVAYGGRYNNIFEPSGFACLILVSPIGRKVFDV